MSVHGTGNVADRGKKQEQQILDYYSTTDKYIHSMMRLIVWMCGDDGVYYFYKMSIQYLIWI